MLSYLEWVMLLDAFCPICSSSQEHRFILSCWCATLTSLWNSNSLRIRTSLITNCVGTLYSRLSTELSQGQLMSIFLSSGDTGSLLWLCCTHEDGGLFTQRDSPRKRILDRNKSHVFKWNVKNASLYTLMSDFARTWKVCQTLLSSPYTRDNCSVWEQPSRYLSGWCSGEGSCGYNIVSHTIRWQSYFGWECMWLFCLNPRTLPSLRNW